MPTVKWQIHLRDSILGLLLVGARRNARGPWLPGGELPRYVQEYLTLEKTGRIWRVADVATLQKLKDLAENSTDIKLQRSCNPLEAKALVTIEDRDHYARKVAAAEAKRVREVLKRKDAIRDLKGLGRYLNVPTYRMDFERIKQLVVNRIYKGTDCGCSFWVSEDWKRVAISGYCEGVDQECPLHELTFPFLPEDFQQAVVDADNDGIDLWNETHGCEACGEEDEFGYRPINPKCKSCGGQGEVLRRRKPGGV